MDPKEAMAGSDEFLIRIMCAAYGVCNERDFNVDNPMHAAILLTGALRFAVAIARAHGIDADYVAARAMSMGNKNPVALTSPEDPGVRRWMEQFRQTCGSSIPAAFALRDNNEPLH